ncbi:hypothetical protein CcaverHIS002_0203040 [Cutaneotrichosporon cavernicola]|uniref:C2H2-type domain-containing protein n=1 Tax=Cutaneotrichosporon cavernicola TaxID=279322 RepID=A0AA48L1H7_9TREE|nr:uncharacterized protein CcaverHIS019_0203040 [Cutaneotrichosporon cavernicola]BEI81144.1 hypothetical protein CcaverHIS002_0203040 [Cutaneotrichosporon cavernicola]BEI88942.1 hypothetical protein CcaverHIS019_0203040 [Cutaneotrichosporon cavernicola]BEI96719.1 hypothetical protein CcaverHIS631_0203080 [Cutaneotrichosporon cavernicola]BEJ04491.1 hypothetical protein CcaverHIS641_0203080 [Cutaneotrichosporon cavernicola]
MQQTPSFLPIPGGHKPSPHRQASFGTGGAEGSSRWGEGGMLISSTPPNASPSSNPHSGFHPGSYGAPLSFSALALGATQPGSSPYSSSMAMSISPPRWGGPGSLGGFGGGSFVGSVGALGTSYGRNADSRQREIEASFVKDLTCCGRQLSGLHELLEHYEEEHANLAPDMRMAAINAVQSNSNGVKRSFTPNTTSVSMNHSDVPVLPGMMDMDMDEPSPTHTGMYPQASVNINLGSSTTAASPWAGIFRGATNIHPPACVPPSLLSYAPPPPATPVQPVPTPPQQPPQTQTPTTPTQAQPQLKLSQAEIEARVFKKAVKKAEQRAVKEIGSEEDPDAPTEKRFRCPIEGCGKVYKQANGLKYHLTRSINSGHGNVAAMGGLLSLLGEDKM